MNQKNPVLSPAFRTWVYGVVSAALAIIAAYGLISADEVPLWLTLVTAILGLAGSGTATIYRPTRDVPGIDPGAENSV